MPAESHLKRKSFFVDQRRLREAKRILGVRTDAEVVRLSVDRVVEMEKFLALHGHESRHARHWQHRRELRRGARATGARQLVQSLYRLAAVQWEPTTRDWWEAGRVIRKIGDARGWDIVKRREFQNDALIALTARRHGAMVVTANARDFALLEGEIGIIVRPL